MSLYVIPESFQVTFKTSIVCTNSQTVVSIMQHLQQLQVYLILDPQSLIFMIASSCVMIGSKEYEYLTC